MYIHVLIMVCLNNDFSNYPGTTSTSGGSRVLSQCGKVTELVSELVMVLHSDDTECEYFPLELLNASSALIPVCTVIHVYTCTCRL